MAGAAAYNVYRSPVSGGGYVKANGSPVTGTDFDDTGLRNGQTYYYVVRALDAAGNESGPSNEGRALPHLTIGWANLQWPPTLSHTISVDPHRQRLRPGLDRRRDEPAGRDADAAGPARLRPRRQRPGRQRGVDVGGRGVQHRRGQQRRVRRDPAARAVGTFDYAYRYSTTNGRDWVYADLDGIGNGYSPAQAGADRERERRHDRRRPLRAGLQVTVGLAGVDRARVGRRAGDPSLYGYEVLRGDRRRPVRRSRGSRPRRTRTAVTEGNTYHYVVRSLDTSFNRSGNSSEVSATA